MHNCLNQRVVKAKMLNIKKWQRGRLGLAVAILTVSAVGLMTGCSAPLKKYQYSHRQMGTMFKLTFYATDDATANKASKAAFDRVDQLNRIMSDYYRPSELNKLSATAGSGKRVRLSYELATVLKFADRVSNASRGAFDVTVGPAVGLWRNARKNGKLPDAKLLKQAVAVVGHEHLALRDVTQGGDHEVRAWTEAELKVKGMKLDLGGIAKGYAGDQVRWVLQGHGIESMLLDAGGDIRVGAPPPNEKGWKIGIAPLDALNSPPSRYVVLSHAAIATSGDAWQFVEIDGKRYSHIVNPKTGVGLTVRSSVTIVVQTRDRQGKLVDRQDAAMAADALASAVSVLGPRRGVELVQAWTHSVAAIVVVKSGDKAEVYESAGVKLLDIAPVKDLQ
jgi:FAD:protein FMN transferase